MENTEYNFLTSKTLFLAILLLTLAFSISFWSFPQLDLSISKFFYRSGHFIFQTDYEKWHLNFYRLFFKWGTYAFLLGLTGALIGGFYSKKIKKYLDPKVCLFLIMCFAIAPGFIVNQLLKDHWGRARPYQVESFGGSKIFTPAWVMSQQCSTNCSFTSGETANVFCYLALIFVVRRKNLFGIVIALLGGLMILERVGQGDHFFSDAILSVFLDYLTIWLIYYLFFPKIINPKTALKCDKFQVSICPS